MCQGATHISIFETVKDSISFESVARDHGIEFNRSGKAPCPFHDEKTPSFHNYGDHGYCHACGKRADVINIESHFTGLPPFEAALSLAKKNGIRLPEYSYKDREKADEQIEAYELLEKFVAYANKEIKKHPEVMDFLKSKGLDEIDIDRWHIGYVGDGNPVAGGLKGKERELGEQIGLTNRSGNDYFKNRIILSILNYGKVVYLTGRALHDGEPKYSHSRIYPLNSRASS